MVKQGEILFKKYPEIVLPPYLDTVQVILNSFINLDVVSSYKVLTGKVPWTDIVNAVIFDAIGDLPHGTTLEGENNGFKNRIAWSTGILNQAFVTRGDNNTTGLRYKIESRNPDKYGIATPLRTAWDLETKEDLSVLHSDRYTINVNYQTNDGLDEFVNNLHAKTSMKGTRSVRLCGAASGSAAAALASPSGIRDIIRQIRPSLAARDLFDDPLCQLINSGDECDASFLISSIYNNFSPILKSDGAIQCDVNEDDLCVKWGTDETIDKKKITDDAPIHLADGFYTGDDSGVVNMIYELQQKFPNATKIKAVSFVNYGFSNPVFPDSASIGITSLFGKGSGCQPNSQQTDDKVNIGLPGANFIDLYAPQVKIFDGDHCGRYKRIFSGVYDTDSRWTYLRNCNPVTTFCTALIQIDCWSGVPTVENREFGIKAGQYVDLFVINFRVGVFGAPLFVLPTDLGSDESTDFNNILNDHSEHIYNIIKKLPQNVYDVVFGDETYCPSDFTHQTTSTNYY